MQAELPRQQYMTFNWITGASVGEELGKAINNVSTGPRCQAMLATTALHVLSAVACGMLATTVCGRAMARVLQGVFAG